MDLIKKDQKETWPLSALSLWQIQRAYAEQIHSGFYYLLYNAFYSAGMHPGE